MCSCRRLSHRGAARATSALTTKTTRAARAACPAVGRGRWCCRVCVRCRRGCSGSAASAAIARAEGNLEVNVTTGAAGPADGNSICPSCSGSAAIAAKATEIRAGRKTVSAWPAASADRRGAARIGRYRPSGAARLAAIARIDATGAGSAIGANALAHEPRRR